MYRWLLYTFICCALIGCDAPRKISKAERDNRGGIVDQATDRLLIADTAEMRVLRGYAVAAAVSGLALETGLGKAERQAAAAQLVSTVGILKRSYDCAKIYPECIYFDTRMFDVNKAMFGLTKAVLPIDEVRKLTRVSKFGVSTIRALLDLSGRAVKGSLRVAAIYRDTWDLYVNVYLDYLENESIGASGDGKVMLERAISDLERAHMSGAGNIRAWKNIVRNFENKHPDFALYKKSVKPEAKHFNAVIKELTNNCKTLAEGEIEKLCAFKPFPVPMPKPAKAGASKV